MIFTDSINHNQMDKMAEIIQSYNDTIKTQIFTYSFTTTNNTTDSLMEDIACNYDG